MKILIILLPLIFCYSSAFTQNAKVEEEIKRLEQMEVKAILEKDTITLKKLWDNEYVVNNPDNKVILAIPNAVNRPVLNTVRASFTREVEYITVRNNIVLTMGNETVVPGGDSPKSGQSFKRRYTHIWMQKDGVWKLAARHANIICPAN